MKNIKDKITLLEKEILEREEMIKMLKKHFLLTFFEKRAYAETTDSSFDNVILLREKDLFKIIDSIKIGDYKNKVGFYKIDEKMAFRLNNAVTNIFPLQGKLGFSPKEENSLAFVDFDVLKNLLLALDKNLMEAFFEDIEYPIDTAIKQYVKCNSATQIYGDFSCKAENSGWKNLTKLLERVARLKMELFK